MLAASLISFDRCSVRGHIVESYVDGEPQQFFSPVCSTATFVLVAWADLTVYE